MVAVGLLQVVVPPIRKVERRAAASAGRADVHDGRKVRQDLGVPDDLSERNSTGIPCADKARLGAGEALEEATQHRVAVAHQVEVLSE